MFFAAGHKSITPRYIRERGDLALEKTIGLLTSRQADSLRIIDRGRIAIGAFADLILFDPEKPSASATTPWRTICRAAPGASTTQS